ncbi:MAG: hypothetical protein QOD75_2801 [Blastocatellia bacterium]|nr:hypothetical protein [Blastocatellia bacterium]
MTRSRTKGGAGASRPSRLQVTSVSHADTCLLRPLITHPLSQVVLTSPLLAGEIRFAFLQKSAHAFILISAGKAKREEVHFAAQTFIQV